MSNFIGQIVTPELDSQFIKSVVVPSGGLHGGQVVTLEEFANFTGNHEVYTCGEPTTGEMFGETMAIVLNQGFETLADGRRLEGQPNYYTYEYAEGEVVSAVFIAPHIKYLISADTIDSATRSSAAVGKYLVPQNALYDLAVADAIPEYCACGLKIVAVYNVPLGGNYGGQFATAYVCVGETQGVERGTDILTFSLEEQVGEAVIDHTAHTIAVTLASTAMIESQVATFTLSNGATAFVGETEQESGVSENDFTNAVEYDIVAESEEVTTWTVTATIAE